MQPERFYYLIHVQYLGYRLHGWQRQPGLKTVEGLIKKTLKFVLGERRIKILGAGRTDAMVSAQEAAFELFLDGEPLKDLENFIYILNKNLPPDIRAINIQEVDSSFNIIQHSTLKEYVYLFSFGEKSHPFCASMLVTFLEELDIELMKSAAQIFCGKHDFRNYCTKPTSETTTVREILRCEIIENKLIHASFFPEKTFALHVEAEGFLRNQIRLMMGTIVLVGRGEFSLEKLKESLLPNNEIEINFIAPGSGLILNKIDFK